MEREDCQTDEFIAITFDRDTFFLRRVASRNEKRRGVRTSVREDRIQMRKGKREGDLEKNSERNEKKRVRSFSEERVLWGRGMMTIIII